VKDTAIQTLEQRQMQLSAELVHQRMFKHKLETQLENL